jgi:hypothetical protein
VRSGDGIAARQQHQRFNLVNIEWLTGRARVERLEVK